MKRHSSSSPVMMEPLEDRQLMSLTYITGEYTGTFKVNGHGTFNTVFKITGESRRGVIEGTWDLYTSKTNFDAFAFTGRVSGNTVSFDATSAGIEMGGTVTPSKGTIVGTAKQPKTGETGSFSVKYFRRISG